MLLAWEPDSASLGDGSSGCAMPDAGVSRGTLALTGAARFARKGSCAGGIFRPEGGVPSRTRVLLAHPAARPAGSRPARPPDRAVHPGRVRGGPRRCVRPGRSRAAPACSLAGRLLAGCPVQNVLPRRLSSSLNHSTGCGFFPSVEPSSSTKRTNSERSGTHSSMASKAPSSSSPVRRSLRQSP